MPAECNADEETVSCENLREKVTEKEQGKNKKVYLKN